MYYKVTRANGGSYYNPDTKYEVGKTIVKPKKQNPEICTSDVLHASERAINALNYGKIKDLKVFKVSGKVVVSRKDKSGFFRLKVLSEIPESKWDEVFGFKISEARNPINPMKIETIPTENDWKLVDSWASVWDSVGASVWVSVWDSVGASVGNSVWDSVWDSVGASVGDSVWDPVWAYIGSLFPNVKKWKGVKHKGGEYPFQPGVDLWKRGMIPVFYQEEWKLVSFKADKAIIHERPHSKEMKKE